MPRLSQEAHQVVSAYIAARYSHWEKPERTRRRKQVIRALKKGGPEAVEKYVKEAKEALERSGL
jgi:hypothetical protein